MITEDYVSFETAKLLKEKGFEERIRSWYDNNGVFHEEGCRMSNSDCLPPTVMAPTLQMVMKWLREEKVLLLYRYLVVCLIMKSFFGILK